MKAPALIGHLDADCFYVSAERVRFAPLRGVPAGVLGNQGACVIAKSYELKAAGVRTGEPVWDARRKCPGAVFLKRDFRWYDVLSRAMFDCVRELAPRAEYYSIDEFFFDATPPRGTDPAAFARAIRDRVGERVGVPVTVGIARTKTLAKLISDSAKPHGARAALDRVGEETLLAGQPVTEIAGIAGRREKRLMPRGLRTCLDLANADRRLVRGVLTCSGEALWWELNGHPVFPVEPCRPRHKALARGGSFGEPTADPLLLYAWLVRNLERLIEELEYHGLLAGHLTVWVGYRDGGAGEGRASVVPASDRFDVLLEAARPCLRRAWRPRAAAGRMHLIAERLAPRAPAQRGLFDGPAERAAAITRLKREVNERIGRWALRSGATLPLGHIYRDPSNEFDICDVRGKVCF